MTSLDFQGERAPEARLFITMDLLVYWVMTAQVVVLVIVFSWDLWVVKCASNAS